MKSNDHFPYAAFISYTTDPDYFLARSIQSFLETFHKLKTPDTIALEKLRIARDSSDLTWNLGKKPTHREADTDDSITLAIEERLQECRWLVVLCSKKTRDSSWVDKEIAWFLKHRGADYILLAVTEGSDPGGNPNFFPANAIKAGLHQKIWFDLRAYRGRKSRQWFKVRDQNEERINLACRLHPGTLKPSDVMPYWFRQERTKLQKRMGIAVSTVIVVSILAVVAWYQKNAAQQQTRISNAQRVAAQSTAERRQHPQLSLLLAAESFNRLEARDPKVTATEQVLRNSLSSIGGRGLQGHEDSIIQLAIAPNGRWLASGSYDATALLWDLHDPTAAPRVLDAHKTQNGTWVNALAFDPKGRWLATAAGFHYGFLQSNDHTAMLWNLHDTTLLPQVLSVHKAEVSVLAFSPDGRWLATGSSDSTIQVWNLENTVLSKPVLTLKDHTESISVLVFSSDSHHLASASRDGAIRLWDLNADTPGIPSKRLLGKRDYVTPVAISPDLHWAVISANNQVLEVWDLQAKQFNSPAKTIPLTGTPVFAIEFSPDSRWFISYPKQVAELTMASFLTTRLWNLDEKDLQRPFKVLPGHEGGIYDVAFSPNSRLLATVGADRKVHVWDLSTEDSSSIPLVLSGHDASINAVTLGSGWLATGGEDHLVRVWNLDHPDFPASPKILKGHNKIIRHLSFSQDERWLASGGDDPIVQIWELSDTILQEPSYVISDHNNRVTGITFDIQQSRIFTGSNDGLLHITTLKPNTDSLLETTLTCPIKPNRVFAASPNGLTLLMSGEDGAFCLWQPDSSDPEKVLRFPVAHSKDLSTATFSDDQRWLATADRRGKTFLWDLSAEQLQAIALPHHTKRVTAMSFDSNGHWLLTGSQDKTAALWNLNDSTTPKRPIILSNPEQLTISSVALSADGRWAITAGYDPIIRLWDLSVLDNNTPFKELRGHQGPINDLATSLDGKALVSASDDHTVRLWDLSADDPSSVPAIILRGLQDEVVTVAISNQWIAAAGTDAMVRLWSRDINALRELAQTTAGRDFSPDERLEFFESRSR